MYLAAMRRASVAWSWALYPVFVLGLPFAIGRADESLWIALGWGFLFGLGFADRARPVVVNWGRPRSYAYRLLIAAPFVLVCWAAYAVGRWVD